MSKKNISRKDFIKGCSATVGLLSLGAAGRALAEDGVRSTQSPTNLHNDFVPGDTNTRRGSWLADPKQTKPGDINLVSATEKCTIVVNKNEDTAVQQAATFLAADIEKITGYRPSVSEKALAGSVAIHLSTIGNKDVPADLTRKLQGLHESYYIKTAEKELWLVGSDFRGTAFAAYCLCERIGIDPLYHWTGYRPAQQIQLILKTTDHYSPPPVFKYRGFFNDDEDVLPRPFERSGYPLRIGDIDLVWYQRYFETALRLGMNMAAPFCRVHRRYEVQKCASDWGLYYTSHHYDILLSNPFGIERYRLAEKRGVSTDWDWFSHKENMIKYWRGGVEENKNIQAIWPVGLRGTDDHAYEFPKNTPDKVQADVFSAAIDTQVNMVRSIAKKDQEPLFHFTMYTEMLDKYEQHPDSFNLPKDVMIVWPDNDDGLMRSLPRSKGKWKHGVYYHLAYFGKNISKQGPHVISPSRIAEEFKKIKKAGATEFLLVNVSEMREHVMEMRLIAELCNHDSLFEKEDTANEFIRWWANEYFGNEAVRVCQLAYQQYFDLYSSSEKVWYGTDMVQKILTELLKKIDGKTFMIPDPKVVAELNGRIRGYETAMATIAQAEKNMSRPQRQFFYENLTLGLLMDQRPCQAAKSLLQALTAKGDNEQWQYVVQAIAPLEKLETELTKAERAPFERWYGETWIKSDISPLNYHRAYKQLRELLNTGGKMEIKTRGSSGHNIPGAQLWSDYLDAADKIGPAY